MEEHISQLMSEIKKKNRVIQSYVMNIEPGALISEQSDIHKVGSRISPGMAGRIKEHKVNFTNYD